MLRFPLVAFRENRLILAREELEMRIREATQLGKSPEVGFYSFSTWLNSKPVLETIIIDKVVVQGKEKNLEKLAEEKLKKGIESMLLFDGKYYFLFISEPQEKLEDLVQYEVDKSLKVLTNPLRKFVFPKCINLRTGEKSRIIKRWRINGK